MKKVLLSVLALALVATVAVGGTTAYLTSTDSDKNTMTVGNVAIEQLEYERVTDENGDPVEGVEGTDFEANYGITQSYKLQEFTQNKPALPAVYANGKMAWDEFQQLWNGIGAPGSNDLFDDSMKNVIDKFAFVKNTGNTDAYYRTLIAIEAPKTLADSTIHLSFNANDRFDAVSASSDSKYYVGYVTMDGVDYKVYNMTYNQILAPDEISRPSLLQVYLDPKATNEDCALFGDTWDILVLSQAVQAAGFDAAGTALDSAFGEVNAANVQEWFANI